MTRSCRGGRLRQGERGDFLASLTQRRHQEFNDLQPIVQVLVERLVTHHRVQIAVRRGDDAHVGIQETAPATAAFRRCAQIPARVSTIWFGEAAPL